jgi:ParB family transcriptional regulator, chromosome partitioning protein
MNDDNNNSRLGRGLESLIPRSNGGSDPGGQQPQPSTAQPVSSPHFPEHRDPAPAAHQAPQQASFAPAVEPRQEPASQAEPAAAPVAVPVSRPDLVQPERPSRGGDAIFQIELEKIEPNPDQPRRVFEPEALKDLASSIREFGLLQPIVVTKVETEVPNGTQVKYILISGERRLMASKLLGLERIPAMIRNVSLNRERLELAIIENIQREQLNAIETARAMARLQDEFRMTQREIAVRLGKSREAIANTVRLLDLPSNIQEAIEQSRISESHGRMLLAIPEQAVQQKLFNELMERGLTTRELKARVDAAKPKQAVLPRPVAPELSPELRALQEKLASELGAPVKIQKDGSSGKITISFYSDEELRHITEKLGQSGADGY